MDALGGELPVVAAPMAGGASSPELIAAATRAGAPAFVAAGYRSADALANELDELAAAGVHPPVNLFAPYPTPIAEPEFRAYAGALADEGRAYGLDLATAPLVQDDDDWAAKVRVLVERRVRLVSVTFGLPDAAASQRLHDAGTAVYATVTSVEEAQAAQRAGFDGLIAQGAEAGGHSGVHDPSRVGEQPPLAQLLPAVLRATRLPVLAAGGLASAAHVRAVLDAGARAAVVGTVLLRAHESGASATHRATLVDPRFEETVVTRAFTGRPARGLRNAFIEAHEPQAPLGYPAVHHLTRELRGAAARAGDPDRVHLWAGTGFRSAREAPVAELLRELAGGQ